jgi:HTH-type transcriptional regulator/antitoxin HigA
MTKSTRPFTPDWVSPPGDTIADVLEERNWTEELLAEKLGYSTKFINQLIKAEIPIDEEIAIKLSQVIGSTVQFWLNHEKHYQSELIRLREEEKRLKQWVDWLEKLPVRELMKQGAIIKCRIDENNKPSIVRDLLSFFDVSSPEEWDSIYQNMQYSFRRTRQEQSDVGAISAWIKLGEIEAEDIDCPPYDKAKFEQAVEEIRKLTTLPANEFKPLLQELCREAGVVVILVPAIPKAHISGMARWLTPDKALIQLSLYGKTNDRFWFTFFHEAAHILLHSHQDIFLDDIDGEKIIESEQEREANQWAEDFLIPRQYSNELNQLKSRKAITAFAERLGIHPGIVVGRLQHENIVESNWMNDLKISCGIDNFEDRNLLSS